MGARGLSLEGGEEGRWQLLTAPLTGCQNKQRLRGRDLQANLALLDA